MELMTDGSLFQRLGSPVPISHQQVWEWAKDIATGLCYLHGHRGLVHGDLDSHNVLVRFVLCFGEERNVCK
jgi:serine/threonine protein kinase